MSRQTSKPRRRGRGPGRPSGDDGALREALLDAALASFAQRGVAATTLAGVARAAGATPAVMNYHFGDKDGLVRAVLDERLRPKAEQLAAGLGAVDAPDPVERLRGFALAYARTICTDPAILQLIVREVLTEGGALRAHFAERFARLVAGRVKETVRAAQAAGALRDDVPPEALALPLMALLVFPFVAAPVVAPALGVVVSAERAEALAGWHFELFRRGAAGRAP